MYRPLPDELTIKHSPIEGLGLFATKEIKANTFIGITHIRDEQFENKYIRTPLGGFYNHSDSPTIQRLVSNVLPNLKFVVQIDPTVKEKKFKEIILATDPTSDGEFTAQFIYEKIKDLCPLITRIAIGVPIGSEVNYIDKNTLAKSLIDRRKID